MPVRLIRPMDFMKDKIKEFFRPFIIFAMVCICGLWFFYRENIVGKLDETSLSLFGKTVTGRSPLIQFFVFGGLFLFSVFLPLLFDRLLCRDPKRSRLADAVILLLLSVPAVQFIRICIVQMLRRDDYWEIADAREFGFPGSMFVEIRRYNGRYLSWGLRSLYAVFEPIPFIRVLLCANLVILTAAVSMLVYRLLRFQRGAAEQRGVRLQSVVTAFVIVTAFILLASNIWEVWFWGSGMYVYGLGISLCLLATALVLRIAADDSKRGWNLALTAPVCFLACGCSELCTASLAVFIAVMLVWKRFSSGAWDKRLIFFLAEVCACCVFIFLISGSLNYAGGYAHLDGSGSENILSGLFEGLGGKVHWVLAALWGYTFINYRLWILFIGIFLLIGSRLDFDSRTRKGLVITALLLVLTAHAVLFINAMLDYMPPRVTTIGICWLILAAVLLCFAAGSFIPAKPAGRPDLTVLAFAAFILCLISGSFYYRNIYELETIKGSWIIRELVLRQYADSTEPVETCSLPNPGSFRDDILSDAEDDFNVGTARFYRVPAIFAEKRCPPYGESFTDFHGDPQK